MCPEERTPSVATIDVQFVESLVNKSRVITEAADKTVVLDVEVTVNSNDVTINIFVVENSTETELFLQAVPDL